MIWINEVRLTGRVRVDAATRRVISLMSKAVVTVAEFELVQDVVTGPTRNITREIPCVGYGPMVPMLLRDAKAGKALKVDGVLASPGSGVLKVRVESYRELLAGEIEQGRREDGKREGGQEY